MALYSYQKAEPKIQSREGNNFLKKGKGKKKYLSLVFTILGLVLVGNAVIPLLSYQIRYSSSFNGKMLSPIVHQRSNNLGAIAASAKEDNKDFTVVSSWFEEPVHLEHQVRNNITDYRLSIPELGIDNAWVNIGGENLKEKLIHYPDTALPGQMGNAVVFGHSVLPQFFNPKNYLTIFSTLHTLDSGDEIILDYDGIKYRYLVEKLFEVPPTDVSVLEQRYDSRYLTLITCSPPGTYLRRLIVRARLVKH